MIPSVLVIYVDRSLESSMTLILSLNFGGRLLNIFFTTFLSDTSSPTHLFYYNRNSIKIILKKFFIFHIQGFKLSSKYLKLHRHNFLFSVEFLFQDISHFIFIASVILGYVSSVTYWFKTICRLNPSSFILFTHFSLFHLST